MEEHVRVSFVESPSVFYVLRSVHLDKLVSLHRKLDKFARGEARLKGIIPSVGKIYFQPVLSIKDDILYPY